MFEPRGISSAAREAFCAVAPWNLCSTEFSPRSFPISHGGEPDEDSADREDGHGRGYDAGFADGRRAGRAEAEEARYADDASLEGLRQQLALLCDKHEMSIVSAISAVTHRLVRLIVGEVEVHPDELVSRARQLLAQRNEIACLPTLHCNPADVPLLQGLCDACSVLADREVPRGSLRMELPDGWIEDDLEDRLTLALTALDDGGQV